MVLKYHGQCGREYPSGFYHNSQFVNTHGDTLNKLDSSGLYAGLHVYTDNENNLYNDTISFTLGQFRHGLPVGEWKDHCKDGTFSMGLYACGGGESSSDEKGGWVTKQQGIYNKIGVWRYYNNKGGLQKTIRYDRVFNSRGWTDQTFEMDSSGNFILTTYKFNSNHTLDSRFKKQVDKLYSKNGIPISADYNSFWKDVSYEYDETGLLIQTTRHKKFLGKSRKVTIVKEYNSIGQLKCKTKTKCKHEDTPEISTHGWDYQKSSW